MDTVGHSSAPWPSWDVPPGYLTKHGYHLMELLGAYDHTMLVSQKLLHAEGCESAKNATFYADSDQRTRESAKAFAAGLFPDAASTTTRNWRVRWILSSIPSRRASGIETLPWRSRGAAATIRQQLPTPTARH